jgi:predicted MFS family arabinose efflux permease
MSNDDTLELDRMQEDGAHPLHTEASAGLSRPLVLLMAITCGITVANLYYNQPLLAQMAHDFHVTARQISSIALLTQVGTACGMLLFVPLGDITERRRLIVILLGAVTLALLLAASATGLAWLSLASLAIGLLSVIPHLIVPFAAQLARPEQRGQAVGSVMSGLLIGILLARTVSGSLGALFGWRAVYLLAAVLMVALALTLLRLLPRSRPSVALSYGGMLLSLTHLVRQQPLLRQAALIGALIFGAFSAFWTTLVFLLERAPYRYHPASQAAGLFGLVGVVGAAAAPLVGRVADRYGPRFTLGVALMVLVGSYAVFALFGFALWGLILGVILLDFGVQSAHVSNQTRLYGLLPEARSRLNTVYMVCYFIGGSIGSALGAWGWSLAGWRGVCAAGLTLSGLALVVYALGGNSNLRRRQETHQ